MAGFLALLATGCGNEAIATADVVARTPEALKDAYLSRLRADDVDGAMKLFCQGKTAPRIVELYRGTVESDFSLPVLSAELTGLPPDFDEHDETAVPLGTVSLQFDTSRQASGVTVVQSALFFGRQGDRYCFTMPMVDDNAPPPPRTPTVSELLAKLPPLPPKPEAWNSTPEALVRSFQVDYSAWNRRAQTGDETSKDRVKAMSDAEQGYAELLHKYVRPGFRGEPIAFGSESPHDPARERIVSTRVSEDAAVVLAEAKEKYSSNTYEYSLVRKAGRWYLEQVYYVDDGERLPSL